MSVWNYLQISMDLFFFVGLVVVWMRLNRPAKEDPRMSRGLQLLQSKISILEDLSDRTDDQVKQMLKLLEKKGAHVQEAVLEARECIQLIEQSMNKSMEVAEIFEDKIPHEEIIERQSSKKYIEAAKLAHSGMSVEEIANRVSLDVAEIEFITKVNKDRLMFSEEDLPKWAQDKPEDLVDHSQVKVEDSFERNFQKAFERPEVSLDHLEEIGKKFREACAEVDAKEEKKQEFSNKLKSGMNSALNSVLQPIEDVKSAIRSELEDLSKPSGEEQVIFDWEELEEEKEAEVVAAKEEDEGLSAIDKAMERLEAKASQIEESKTVEEVANNQQNQDLQVPAENQNVQEITIDKARANSFQIGVQEDVLKPKVVDTPKQEVKKDRFDLASKIQQRVEERAQRGGFRTKVKSAEELPSLQSLDFPDIKVTPNDHLG